jgi:hypothetical protein
MRRENNIAGTLEDFIRHYGAPNALFSDNAKSQVGRAVQEILCMYAIKDFQCEHHHQYQNYAEQCIQEVKKLSNTLLDCSGSPPSLWLLCVQHFVYILNHLSTNGLQWKTPLEAGTGQQPDISAILEFHWYEPVYFKHYTSSSATPLYPSKSQEQLGRIVGMVNTREIVSPSLSSTLSLLRSLLVQNCVPVSLLHPLIFEAFSHMMEGRFHSSSFSLLLT